MIEWILSSTALLAVVLLLRLALKGRVSPRFLYGLWALVLVRLLVPVSFGSSQMSVLNTVERARQHTAAVDWAPSEPVDASTPSENLGAQASVQQPAAPTVPEPASVGRQTAWNLRTVLLGTWVAGGAILAYVFLAANGRFAARLRRSRRSLTVAGTRLPVYVSAALDTPCLFGLLRPAVYVTPEAAAAPEALRHTVIHETCHWRQGDALWAVLRCAALCLHWYNPLAWAAAILSKADGELACDAATVRVLGEGERAAYGRTLIAMTCRKPTALLVTATTMTGSARGLKERITMLVKRPRTALSVGVLVALLAAAAVGCTFTGAADAGEPGAPAEAGDGTATAVDETAPAAVWDHAQREVESMTDYYTELGGADWTVLGSSDVELTEVPLGEAAQAIGAHMYQLRYRLQVDNPEAAAAALPAGTELDGNQITEVTAEGRPYLVLQQVDGAWQEAHAILYADSLEVLYNTVEMVAQYGDAYTAAAVEVCSADTTAATDGSEYLTAVLAQLRTEGTATRLVMTVDGDMVVGNVAGQDTDNAVYYGNYLSSYTYSVIPPATPNTDGPQLTILPAAEDQDWSLTFWEGSKRVQLTVNGETYGFAAEMPEDPAAQPVGDTARRWYDEAEFLAAGGSYETMQQHLLADSGQDYLEAARQLCQENAEVHLRVTGGSSYAYTYVRCTVEPAEAATESARAGGEIGENTWAFYLTVVFVPENETALQYAMAGNTGAYTGSDPEVPADAWEYTRCGYVTRTDAGWYAELVGTGW